MARVLILGGAAFQVPVILHALKSGHHVITCDYLPHNPGHRFAHEYYNVSTTDSEAVLALASNASIDGILAFASDPAALTAAHVADTLKLPGPPPESIEILTDKGKFRAFLIAHGFNAPIFCVLEDDNIADVVHDIGFPIMVKPVDSSGSKGVSRIDNISQLEGAVRYARTYSRSHKVIAERWIERDGEQIAGDGIVAEGQLRFTCLGDEHFDLECNPYAPVGESFPGSLEATRKEILLAELQRLFSLLQIRNLVFNLDACFDRSGKLVIIEIGPRAGGNCLPTIIHSHTGVNAVDITLRFALGLPLESAALAANPCGFHASWMIHSSKEGRLRGLRVAPELDSVLIACELFTPFGTPVCKFTSSKDTLGYALFSFPSAIEMRASMTQMATLIEPIVV